MRRVGVLAAALLGVACGFDSSGRGRNVDQAETDTDTDGEDDEESSADDEGKPDDPETGDPTRGGEDDGDPSDGDDAGDSDPTDPSDEGDTADEGSDAGDDGVPNCDEPFELVIWVDEADVAEPMQLLPAASANGEPMVAVSQMEDQGVVTFEFDLPCEGTYYAWGLVWDYYPGAWPAPDPDSFFVNVGGEEWLWHYGCQSWDLALDEALSWQPLSGLNAHPCDTYGVSLEADEGGAYSMTLRNRESGAGSAVAGIGAILISTDPDTDPYAAYAPY